DEARQMAGQILTTLDQREAALRRRRKGSDRTQADADGPPLLDVWDIATRVEALLALDEYESASVALDQYLAHPDMHAFEVSSTYRQFEEVLQLDENPRGRSLMNLLWSAVERHRTGGAQAPPRESATAETAAFVPRPLLVRVSDPDWQPNNIPDLRVK